MTTEKLLVLHCPVGGGHRAAAGAIGEAAAAAGVEAQVVDALALAPRWFADAYVATHLRASEHTPSLYGLTYAAMNRRSPFADGLRGALDRSMGARLVELVRATRPTAIVATHFFPLDVLGHARLHGAIDVPLVGVVTDYAAHAFWAERGVDVFCCAPGRAASDLARHAPRATIVPTGIPVRPAFARVPAVRPIASGETLRVLVTSGGFGVGPMSAIVRSFRGAHDVELAVVCGANERRVEEAERALASEGVRGRVVGFERDMPRRFAEAHVVVGKPGGSTVSEALVAGRPMVLVGGCPGQELENQRWLIDEGVATASSAAGAGDAVRAMRARGEVLVRARRARSLGLPNAARTVVEVALSSARARLAA